MAFCSSTMDSVKVEFKYAEARECESSSCVGEVQYRPKRMVVISDYERLTFEV